LTAIVHPPTKGSVAARQPGAAVYRHLPFAVPLALVAAVVFADGPADNIAENVRPVPPPGIAVPDAERAELQQGVEALGKVIADLRRELTKKPALLDLLPDVQIFHNAVRYALTYNEFYDPKEFVIARDFLKQGHDRARLLHEGKAPWTTATGLVVRGYVSKIDGSVQPYGLVVPSSFRPDTPYKHRLDLWCHGRGEKLTELNFLNQRQKSPGEFTPPHAFVLHLYGRYCNANKFAGEIDALEAMDHVKKHYPIDDDRVVIRGFSMGGAACWQFAVHYPDLWCAAAPGAGFSETPEFLKHFQKETLEPTWWEKKLWGMYDCTDYALNIANVPTVAYSGENDIQKQAADMMVAALEKEGMRLMHIIGPKTGHSYHPEAKNELNRRIDAIVAKGRPALLPYVDFTTRTLRYNRCGPLTIDGLKRHWEKSEVIATALFALTTKNVTALTLSLPPGRHPWLGVNSDAFSVAIDENLIEAPGPFSDGSWTARFRLGKNRWELAPEKEEPGLHKRHGLQGPIDDAFMDSFLIVRPTGQGRNDKPAEWVKSELARAIDHWRKQFRGEARVKDDSAVTEADIADHNLILWGDPASNMVLAKIADRLPILWEGQAIHVAKRQFDAAHHAPTLIYPNPLNPKRYVVLNSGFTFRDYDYLNNARQVPKLPDWAVFDVRTPPNSRWAGKVVAAGFFEEAWQLQAEGK
jgi:pimeloyl-ACP methyl ester carboxylesterase